MDGNKERKLVRSLHSGPYHTEMFVYTGIEVCIHVRVREKKTDSPVGGMFCFAPTKPFVGVFGTTR